MNGFKFEKLIIWQRVMELGKNINDEYADFFQEQNLINAVCSNFVLLASCFKPEK
jgi:hypothetical protein